MSNAPITALLEQDHLIVREGLRRLLAVEDDIVVVGETNSGRDTVRQTLRLKSDVVGLAITNA